MRIRKQIVKHVGIEDGHIPEFLAEQVYLNVFAVLLGQIAVECFLLSLLGQIPFELPTPLVFLHLPTIGDEGVCIAVDDVWGESDFGAADENVVDISKDSAFAKSLDVIVRVICTPKCKLEFVGLTNII